MLNNMTGLLVLLLFGFVVILVVYDAQQDSELLAQPKSPIAVPTPDSCVNTGKWIAYTDPIAGYSLEYPAEARLDEWSKSNDRFRSTSIFLNPSCYGQGCWGSHRIIISTLQNPNRLSIQQYVEEFFNIYTSPPLNDSVQNYQSTKRLVKTAGVDALRIEDGITVHKPEIFVPHQDKVVRIYVSAGSTVPPYEMPCETTLELLDRILSSLTLLQ